VDTTTDTRLREAVMALRQTRPQEAIAILRALVADARRDGAAEDEMLALGLLAPALVATGDAAGGRAAAARAIELARAIGDEESVEHYQRIIAEVDAKAAGVEPDPPVDRPVDSALDRAASALGDGDGRAAARHLRPIIAWATATGRRDVEAGARGMMGQALMMARDLEAARDQLERAQALADGLGDRSARIHFGSLLTSLESEPDADRAVALARIAAAAQQAARRAGRALEEGDADAALQALYPALHGVKRAGARPAEATLRGIIAQALIVAGQREGAVTQARHAMSIAEELGDVTAAEGFRTIAELAMGFVPPMGEA